MIIVEWITFSIIDTCDLFINKCAFFLFWIILIFKFQYWCRKLFWILQYNVIALIMLIHLYYSAFQESLESIRRILMTIIISDIIYSVHFSTLFIILLTIWFLNWYLLSMINYFLLYFCSFSLFNFTLVCYLLLFRCLWASLHQSFNISYFFLEIMTSCFRLSFLSNFASFRIFDCLLTDQNFWIVSFQNQHELINKLIEFRFR